MNKIDSVHDTILDGEYMIASFGKLSIGDITIRDEGKNYIYNPKKDITTYELSKIMQLFFTISATKSFNYDTIGFVKKYNLDRHFDET